MRITFSNETKARTAVAVLERYGYHAVPKGPDVETECPPLLAVPAVGNAVGLDHIEKVHLAAAPRPPGSRLTAARA